MKANTQFFRVKSVSISKNFRFVLQLKYFTHNRVVGSRQSPTRKCEFQRNDDSLCNIQLYDKQRKPIISLSPPLFVTVKKLFFSLNDLYSICNYVLAYTDYFVLAYN